MFNFLFHKYSNEDLKHFKKYFKRADYVRCLADNKVYKIDYKSLHKDIGGIWCSSINGDEVCLYDFKNNTYATVIQVKHLSKTYIFLQFLVLFCSGMFLSYYFGGYGVQNLFLFFFTFFVGIYIELKK